MVCWIYPCLHLLTIPKYHCSIIWTWDSSSLWILVPITYGVAMVIFGFFDFSLKDPKFLNIGNFLYHFTLFPVLVIISPLFELMITFIWIWNRFERKPKLIVEQHRIVLRERGGTLGQLLLQLYIASLATSAKESQWFSIISSIISLPMPLLQQFEAARSMEIKPSSFLKSIVFLPMSLQKLLFLNLIIVFFRWPVAAYIIVGWLITLGVFLALTYQCFNLKIERDFSQELTECLVLSLVTMTNLGTSKTATLFRVVSSVFWTTAHSITIAVILYVCNDDPSNIDIFGVVRWSELALVQDIFILNILLITTICLGWISLGLDVIYATVKYRYCYPSSEDKEDQTNMNRFWNGALLLEGLSHLSKQPLDGQTSSQNSEHDTVVPKDAQEDAVTNAG